MSARQRTRQARQRQAARLHALGPRAVFEFLDELARHYADGRVDDRLAAYARLDPGILRALGGDRFPPTIFAAPELAA